MKGKELFCALSEFLKGATNFENREIFTFSSLITAYSITDEKSKADVLKVFIFAVDAVTKILAGTPLETAMKTFNVSSKLN